MATYGVDLYEKSFYGAPVASNIAVTNLAATQIDFGRVRISWTAPVANVWTELVLVRSRYGFPAQTTDGDLLAAYSSTQASTVYDDSGLTPGYWYYGVFAAAPLAAWSAALTYQIGDRVSYSAQNWIALQIAPPGTAPATGAYWEASEETQLWLPAGAVASMSVADHGFAALLDGYVPDAYKGSPVLTTDTTAVNDDLSGFLAVLGWGFEIAATENDDLFHLYDTSSTRYDRLLQISRMLGISVEGASSPRYQRLRTAQAAALGREKGTGRGLADMIEAATGLSCTVSTGPNMLIGRDQSDFPYPLYPAWQSNESYSVGDLVTYQGARYQCQSWALSPALTGSPNAASTGTSPQPYTAEVSATQPSSLTATITIPATGVYYLSFVSITGPANGIISVQLDGVTQQMYVIPGALPAGSGVFITGSGWHAVGITPVTTLDTYSAATGVGNRVSVPANLTAGTHTVKFLSTAKNASATGYDVQLSNTAVGAAWTQWAPSTTPPSAGGAGTGAQWSSPPALVQSSYANAQTGQASTWSSTQSAVTLLVNYLGAAGYTRDTNWLTVLNGGLSLNSVYAFASAAYPEITAYSAVTSYLPGQIVTGPDGLQYTAVTATTALAPPAPGTWARTAYNSPYDRELVAQSTAPVRTAPPYDPHASYAEGAMVAYNDAVYVAPAPLAGITPPAAPDCNSGWEYLGPAAGRMWIASLYNPAPATGSLPVYPGVEFYDQYGQPIAAPSLMTGTGTLTSTLPVYARLLEYFPDLSGSALDTGPHPFTVSTAGTWQISSGAGSVSPAYTGSGTQILLLYTDSGMSDGCVGATFVTGVTNRSVRDVGIVFRLSDSTHFLVAFRDQLLTYSSGTKIVLASYTRLPVGTRMFVQLSGVTIKLYAYPGNSAAPTLVTTVASTFNQSSTNHGLVDWTW